MIFETSLLLQHFFFNFVSHCLQTVSQLLCGFLFFADPHYRPAVCLLCVSCNQTAHPGSTLSMEPLNYCEWQPRRVLLPCAPLSSPSPRHCQTSNWLRIFLAVLGVSWNLEEDALAKLELQCRLFPPHWNPTGWQCLDWESVRGPEKKKKNCSVFLPRLPPFYSFHSQNPIHSRRKVCQSYSHVFFFTSWRRLVTELAFLRRCKSASHSLWFHLFLSSIFNSPALHLLPLPNLDHPPSHSPFTILFTHRS